MKNIILLIAIVVIIASVFSFKKNVKVFDTINTGITNSESVTTSMSAEPETKLIEENEFYNPRVVAESAWHMREQDNQKLYEKLFEIEDELVRREILMRLYRRVTDEDDFASMMIGLVQSGINVEQVLSYAAILPYEGFDTVYSSVRDILTEDQRKIFLNQYARSASLNEDEFIPPSLKNDMQTYGIKVDNSFLFNTIVLLEDEDNHQSYRDNPKTFENFSQIPQTDEKGELVTWWYAFRTIYLGTSQEIELTEKLRYSETGNYDWLINMSMQELEDAHFEYFVEKHG